VFDPAGYVGLAYWYLFCPVHELVFAGMFRGVVRAARRAAHGPGGRCRPFGGACADGAQRVDGA
jgi:hypothetical protein